MISRAIQPPEDVPVAARVATLLREAILRGEIKPGTRLKDVELAAQYDVSRNTLRDAVKRLEIDGLVISIRHAGNAVRTVTERDARDIYAVRRAVEMAAVEAATAVTTAELSTLLQAVEASQKAAKDRQWNELGTASLRFHQTLVALLRSDRMDAFFANILAQLRLVFAVMDDESTFQAQWLERDERLAKLLLSGRSRDAQLELHEYLNDSEAQVIEAIRSAQFRG